MSNLTKDDLIREVRDKVTTQDYTKKEFIDGVRLIELKTIVGEQGDFGEVARFDNGELEGIPGFEIAQINRTTLNPDAIKAFHLHFKQDEIWYLIPSDHLLVGLWDVRENSKTSNKNMKVVLGGGKSCLLFIPRGVAHGCMSTINKPVELFYLVSEKFDMKDPDEKRLPWDSLGSDFWQLEKE